MVISGSAILRNPPLWVKKKTHINIIIINNADSGKYITSGHLTCKCGGIDKKTMRSLRRQQQRWTKAFSSIPGCWTKWRQKESVASPWNLAMEVWDNQILHYHHWCPRPQVLYQEHDHWLIPGDCAMVIVASNMGISEVGLLKNRQICKYTTGLHSGCEATHHGCQWDRLHQAHPCTACFHKITKEVRAYIKKISYNSAAMAFLPISG